MKGPEKDHKPYSETAFTVFRFRDSEDFDIEGDNLFYAEVRGTHYGLQCNYTEDMPEHRLIEIKLKKVAQLLREVEKINEI